MSYRHQNSAFILPQILSARGQITSAFIVNLNILYNVLKNKDIYIFTKVHVKCIFEGGGGAKLYIYSSLHIQYKRIKRICTCTCTLTSKWYKYQSMTLGFGSYKPFGPVLIRTLLARIHIHWPESKLTKSDINWKKVMKSIMKSHVYSLE